MSAEGEFDRVFAITSFIISVGLAISFWLSQVWGSRQHQKYIKQSISNNIKDLIEIVEKLYSKADSTYSDNQAKNAYEYFSRKINRMELLRINVDNLLTQLKKDDKYKQKIKSILEIESWLLDTYNNPTIDDTNKFYLWKTNTGELMTQTQNIVNIATELKIKKPITIS
ncbi:MAG: hypothetical protein WD717_02100 [Nitrosarchaeum sp.]